MSDGYLCLGLQVQLAADIGGGDDGRFACLKRFQFVVQKLLGDFRLQNRVGSRRTAAEMAVGNRCQLEAQAPQNLFDQAGQLLTVLQ